MKITYIKTVGFRKFETDFETDLFDVTSITGGNAKGKTNILYAIIWGFLGCNLTGDDKVYIGNKNTDNIQILEKYKINIKEIIYYLITIVTLVLSSMIGINFKKQKK